MAVNDLMDRPINAQDYVVYFNRIYQVISVGKPNQNGHGPARIILIDKSKSTREVTKYSNEMCLIPAGDVLIWKLKK